MPGRDREEAMSRQTPFLSEFVSLTVMLLMIVALVAGQADAMLNDARADETAPVIALAPELTQAPARIRANFELDSFSITIDASADVRRLIPDAR